MRRTLIVVAVCAAAFALAWSQRSVISDSLCSAKMGFWLCETRGLTYVDGRIEVRFWHSMSGTNGQAIDKMADDFNESQDQYHVEPIYQGGYPQSLKKLVSSFGTSSMPTMVQLDDIEVQFMIDSLAVTPVQQFIEIETFDLSDYDPRALAYYTVDDMLYAMPFNLSGPVLYYDKRAFEEAGLDPEKPPRTLDDVRAYSERLLTRNDDGSIKRNGISLAINAWYFEQMLAKQGALYANNENGRGDRATAVSFDSPAGREILAWWQEMVHEGLATNMGRDALQAMLNVLTGKSAMTIASTGSLQSVLIAIGPENAARFGVGALPAPASPQGGIVLGGAAVWIMNDRPTEEQQGAWEFLKYATQPSVQALWHVRTGYFPVRLSSWNMGRAAKLHKDYPQFTVARQQVLDSPLNNVTAGAVLGPFTQVRESVELAFEQVLVGGETPDEAMERARDESNRAIERYNRSVE